MRIIILFIGILTLLSFAKVASIQEKAFIQILPNSKLKIRGKSNINKFTCNFHILKVDKPIAISYQKKENKMHFNTATLPIKNDYFDCGGRRINKDFHKLLKTKQYPKILLSLKEIEYKEQKIEAIIEMKIAGISKTYTTQVAYNNDKILNVSGVLKLNISDFNLESPTKLLGIIVVSDIIEIDFNLNLKQV